jgi:hypothetical protein
MTKTIPSTRKSARKTERMITNTNAQSISLL